MVILTIRKWYLRFTHLDMADVVEEHEAKRAELDQRLSKVAKATVNGDEDWFTDNPNGGTD